VVGNVFCQGPGILISPANSRGELGGGLDLQLKLRFGVGLEAELQDAIRRDYGGRLPVGKAIKIATRDRQYPFVIFAPTRRSYVGILRHPADVRKAAAAAFSTVLELVSHAESPYNLGPVIVPGFGTGMGGMDPETAGRAMFRAFRSIIAQQ
jgi:O-acetyl-ADP-ribose deacetylase (regulator of RNase III)